MLATVDHLIAFIGRDEAIAHSQLDNPESEVIDRDKLAAALTEAATLLRDKVPDTWPQFAYCQKRIARRLLDPFTNREPVIQGEREAWELVKGRSKPIQWT